VLQCDAVCCSELQDMRERRPKGLSDSVCASHYTLWFTRPSAHSEVEPEVVSVRQGPEYLCVCVYVCVGVRLCVWVCVCVCE